MNTATFGAAKTYSEKLVSASRVKFVTLKGKNLIDTSQAVAGYYVNRLAGGVLANATYTALPYIPVDPATTYTLSGNAPGTAHNAFYDANKVFIGPLDNVATFTTPSNCAYVGITVQANRLGTIQLEAGSAATSYQAFQGYETNTELVAAINENAPADNFSVTLPPEICIAVGRTIEIYNKQICHAGNINNYHFKYTCSLGKTYKRKWSYTATSDKVGNYAMTVTVYDNNLKVVGTASTAIKVVNKTAEITTAKKILWIGDSLSNDKPNAVEFKALTDAMFGADKIQFIGTRGTAPYKHEGRSGWTVRTYATNYMEQITLTVSGVTTIPTSKKVYKLPDTVGGLHDWAVETTNISSGSGTITFNRVDTTDYVVAASGVATAIDSAGSGDSSITFSSWTPAGNNPFWNQSTNALDFNNYLTANGLTKPDIVQIFLGANDTPYWNGDMAAVTASMQTRFGWLKAIIDTILAQWSGTKIFLVLTPFYANQDGLGENYANQYIDIQVRLNVYTWHYNLIQQYNAYNANVTIVPVGQTMDAENDYIPTSRAVNPRSSQTEIVQTGGVHPSNEGYYQMADAIFSTFVGHYV